MRKCVFLSVVFTFCVLNSIEQDYKSIYYSPGEARLEERSGSIRFPGANLHKRR
ncbi:MAG: hypothetical protein KAW19_04255 [Candidatus Aminicenantes bacterium]|nr:hypothetical protein [Candidatus Aminicenantes bacterium]